MLSFLSLLLFALTVVILPCFCSLKIAAPIERRFARYARLRWAGPLTAALVSLAVNLLIFAAAGPPAPLQHDEFGYLLAGDTYAHGRLTNPPHIFWKSLETFHELQTPTRQAKYPPAQGLSLALGQVLTGLPIAGVWIVIALACAALVWMLQAWLPRRWALLGGILAAIQPTMLDWGQSYWGGGVAFLGGALLFGAWRRAADRPSAKMGFVMGLGIAILASSRPFEGAVAAATTLVLLGISLLQQRSRDLRAIRRFGAALGAALALNFLWLGFYNHAVTGSALRLPYVVYEKQYGVVPTLLWQPLRPMIAYNNAPMRDMVTEANIPLYREQRTPGGFLQWCGFKFLQMGQASFPMGGGRLADAKRFSLLGLFEGAFQLILLIPLIFLPSALARDPWLRRAGVIICVVILALLAETWFNSHYNAPSAPLVALLIVASIRQLSLWRGPQGRIGRSVCRVVCVVCLLSAVGAYDDAAANVRGGLGQRAARVRAALARAPGQQLVFVRYGPRHPWRDEWVFNAADMDSAKIVWAREMDPAQDALVRSYYPKRKVWLLTENQWKSQLSDYDKEQPKPTK
ncbi:hypothetical protein CCAX7_17470 [Capsulimonas corticalis]|uniref:Uncharacterized protein n=1 Tax=Capsulimonas corticalis TaxID=2219043 RepID=A0A402D3Y1_9BACT|nr:hypothetical protein [Capsulimonas corticalis]BDI29696.1 hypothetical protein CCAX7_17470 [Capsulimonas corticalis]